MDKSVTISHPPPTRPDSAPETACVEPPAGWRRSALLAPSWSTGWLSFAIGFAAVVAIFFDASASAVTIWYSDPTYNHAFLILPIFGYLVWVRRTALARIEPRPCLWGLLAMGVAGLGALLGDATSVREVEHLALVGMIQSLFLTVLGWRAAKTMAFPLFYLFFLVPVGGFLVAPLQDFTAFFSVTLLQLSGIPVFTDGVFISIPEGHFEVAEACAGLRFLIATLALGFLFANLTYRSPWRRAAFLALTVTVPLIANGFRAFGIVLIGHLSDMTIAVGVDHLVYGWIFFAFVTLLLLAIGTTFRERSAPIDDQAGAGPPSWLGAGRLGRQAAASLLAVLVAAIAPAYSYALDARPRPPIAAAIKIPIPADGWSLLPRFADSWRPQFHGADRILLQSYVKGDQRVDLFIAYYARQDASSEMIQSRNGFVDGEKWRRIGSRTITAEVEGQRLEIERTRIRNATRHRVVWSWYWIDGEFTADKYRSKLLQAAARLWTGRESAAVIAIATDYRERENDADQALAGFARALGSVVPELSALGAR